MSSRFTKSVPEYIYFVGEGEWISGPYVRPQRGSKNRKFRIEEVLDEEVSNLKKEKVPSPPQSPKDRLLKEGKQPDKPKNYNGE